MTFNFTLPSHLNEQNTFCVSWLSKKRVICAFGIHRYKLYHVSSGRCVKYILFPFPKPTFGSLKKRKLLFSRLRGHIENWTTVLEIIFERNAVVFLLIIMLSGPRGRVYLLLTLLVTV